MLSAASMSRSRPAQNARPSPRTTTIPGLSRSSAATASTSPVTHAMFIALSFSGRDSTTSATSPARRTCTALMSLPPRRRRCHRRRAASRRPPHVCADGADRSYDDGAVEEHSVKVTLSTPDITPLGWRARRRARRRLAELDALGARLAELSRIRDLVEAAREVVAAGWVKDAWYVRPDGRPVDLVQA